MVVVVAVVEDVVVAVGVVDNLLCCAVLCCAAAVVDFVGIKEIVFLFSSFATTILLRFFFLYISY